MCIGNHDKNFISMSAERNRRFMSATGNTTATEDIKDVKCNDQLISNIKRIRETQYHLNRVQESLINTVEEKGIELDNQTHNDMLTIMQEKSEEIEENFPNDSFRQLFWKQQLEAAIKNNPKQMKWHPLMIRWCLSIRFKSSSPYEALIPLGY